MSSDLQGLIDRIRKEGVDKAESEAGEIVAEARRAAAGILREAESEAQALRDRARAEAAAFEEQGRQTLGKTARDLILSVQQAVERSLTALVHRRVEEALGAGTVAGSDRQGGGRLSGKGRGCGWSGSTDQSGRPAACGGVFPDHLPFRDRRRVGGPRRPVRSKGFCRGAGRGECPARFHRGGDRRRHGRNGATAAGGDPAAGRSTRGARRLLKSSA